MLEGMNLGVNVGMTLSGFDQLTNIAKSLETLHQMAGLTQTAFEQMGKTLGESMSAGTMQASRAITELQQLARTANQTNQAVKGGISAGGSTPGGMTPFGFGGFAGLARGAMAGIGFGAFMEVTRGVETVVKEAAKGVSDLSTARAAMRLGPYAGQTEQFQSEAMQSRAPGASLAQAISDRQLLANLIGSNAATADLTKNLGIATNAAMIATGREDRLQVANSLLRLTLAQGNFEKGGVVDPARMQKALFQVLQDVLVSGRDVPLEAKVNAAQQGSTYLKSLDVLNNQPLRSIQNVANEYFQGRGGTYLNQFLNLAVGGMHTKGLFQGALLEQGKLDQNSIVPYPGISKSGVAITGPSIKGVAPGDVLGLATAIRDVAKVQLRQEFERRGERGRQPTELEIQAREKAYLGGSDHAAGTELMRFLSMLLTPEFQALVRQNQTNLAATPTDPSQIEQRQRSVTLGMHELGAAFQTLASSLFGGDSVIDGIYGVANAIDATGKYLATQHLIPPEPPTPPKTRYEEASDQLRKSDDKLADARARTGARGKEQFGPPLPPDTGDRPLLYNFFPGAVLGAEQARRNEAELALRRPQPPIPPEPMKPSDDRPPLGYLPGFRQIYDEAQAQRVKEYETALEERRSRLIYEQTAALEEANDALKILGKAAKDAAPAPAKLTPPPEPHRYLVPQQRGPSSVWSSDPNFSAITKQMQDASRGLPYTGRGNAPLSVLGLSPDAHPGGGRGRPDIQPTMPYVLRRGPTPDLAVPPDMLPNTASPRPFLNDVAPALPGFVAPSDLALPEPSLGAIPVMPPAFPASSTPALPGFAVPPEPSLGATPATPPAFPGASVAPLPYKPELPDLLQPSAFQPRSSPFAFHGKGIQRVPPNTELPKLPRQSLQTTQPLPSVTPLHAERSSKGPMQDFDFPETPWMLPWQWDSAPTGGAAPKGGMIHGFGGAGGRFGAHQIQAAHPRTAMTQVAPYKAGSLLGQVGINQAQYDAYRKTLGSHEGGRYDIMGGSSGRFAGMYQMGATEIAGAAKALGEPVPSREQFLHDPAMQERFLEAYTAQHHEYLMKHSPQYAKETPEQRLGTLGYAHLLGEGGAANYLNTHISGQDAFHTPGSKYIKDISDALAGLPKSAIQGPQVNENMQNDLAPNNLHVVINSSHHLDGDLIASTVAQHFIGGGPTAASSMSGYDSKMQPLPPGTSLPGRW